MEMVKLYRESSQPTYTYGALVWNDTILCSTLERPWLDNQPKISCIPEGTYTAIAFNSPHNGDVWLLENTTPRSMIEIHAANFAEELEGCIAVGIRSVLNGRAAVVKSRTTLDMLKKKLPPKFILTIIKGEQYDSINMV